MEKRRTEKNFGLASSYDLVDLDDDNDIDDNDDEPNDAYDLDDEFVRAADEGKEEEENRDETVATAGGGRAPVRRKSTAQRPLRPVLTNLAVEEGCRFDGVGSRLVDACEDAVINLWGV